MKKELLSLTDENSILITAEFLESGRRLSYGGNETQRLELDLIVSKNITCQQLLDAVGRGLENALWDLEIPPGSKECEDAIKYIYEDQRLVKRHTPFALSKWQRKKSDRSIQKVERQAEEWDAFPSNEETEKGENGEIKQDLKRNYLVCWSVYQECMHAFQNNYNGLANNPKILENLASEVLKTDYVRSHPVIGRGCINFNALTDRDELFSISSRPQCWLTREHSDRTLKELGFITTTRLVFDPILWHHSAPLFDEREKNPVITPAFHGKTPEYNISDRQLKKLDNEPISVIEPTPPPKQQRQSIVAMVLPTLLSTGTLVGIRMMTSTGNDTGSMLLMTGAMGVTSVVVGLVNRVMQKLEYDKNTSEWRKQYEAYIENLLDTVMERQAKDVELLHKLYPPALPVKEKKGNSLVKKILAIDGDIYSRGSSHPDFLSVRLGVSTEESRLVPSVFEISGAKKEAVFTSIQYINIHHEEGKSFHILQDGKVGIGTKQDGSKGYLIDLPSDIAAYYKYLRKAPVLVNLAHCGALGVVYGDRKKECPPFLDNILLDLCFHHSPEDVQCVMFCEKTDDWHQRQSTIRRYKHLPHFRELLGDLSAFIFDEQDAHRVFNKLSEIMAERKESGADGQLPHVVVFFQNEYSLKRHPFSQFLPEYGENGVVKTDGISFVFCTQYTEQLPKFCGQVIFAQSKDEHLLLPHTLLIPSAKKDKNGKPIVPALNEREDVPFHQEYYSYKPDPVSVDSSLLSQGESDDEYYRAFKTLSALRFERIAQGADMPSNLSLFDMIRHSKGTFEETKGNGQVSEEDAKKRNFLKVTPVTAFGDATSVEKQIKQSDAREKLGNDLREYVMGEWGLLADHRTGKVPGRPKRDVIKSLAVPIGENTQGIVELDLHEKGDGPHMLVAGTTGSGKTETILTYLVNLCALYTPEQVNLMLMDMKGEDFVARIGNLPHVVGKVSDVDGDKTGTNTAYMLKRFLVSMNAEVERRKVDLSKMGVNDISSYIEARENLDKHMRNHNIPENRREELKKLKPMPHLFLVIDEFTELMQFTAENGGVDFKSAITSLARVGRSLGFHIILISQNIENAITPDIRVNSRARLCLKVATREASKEMIGSDLAASPLMPGNGRAYLLVGTGSRFEYFQSAYSGADILGNPDQPILITHATTSGEYQAFFNSEAQKAIDREREELLMAIRAAQAEESTAEAEENIAENTADSEEIVPEMRAEDMETVTNLEEAAPETKTEESEDDVEQKENEPEAKADAEPMAEKANVSGTRAGIRQVELLRDVIVEDVWKNGASTTIAHPHLVFQQPLPARCWFDFDWKTGKGRYAKISRELNEKEES